MVFLCSRLPSRPLLALEVGSSVFSTCSGDFSKASSRSLVISCEDMFSKSLNFHLRLVKNTLITLLVRLLFIFIGYKPLKIFFQITAIKTQLSQTVKRERGPAIYVKLKMRYQFPSSYLSG